MKWYAYPASSSLDVGVEVRVIRFLLEEENISIPTTNDTLIIEFPDNTRDSTPVLDASSNELTVRVSEASWILSLQDTPIRSHDGGLTLNYVVKSNAD